MKRQLILIAASLALSAHGFSLEIPLSGVTSSGGQGAANIGYVDLDLIFRVYPQTKAAKEDYAKQLKKKREQLAEKEKELQNIQSRLSVLESTLKDMPGTAPTSETAPDSTEAATPAARESQSQLAMKKELEDKKSEYEELRKQASADLATFESQQSQMILGKIYQALRDVAEEEQVSIVVDKSAILYGAAAIDLTERLQQRVRGY